MIVPTDADYIETKLLKKGDLTLSPLFQELAEWITKTFSGVTVLNIRYERVSSAGGIILPRLTIIFEWENEERHFRSNDGVNCDRDKQTTIAAEFKNLLARHKEYSFDLHHLFVFFCAFEPVAKLEAVGKITPEQIAGFATALNETAIWKIRKDWAALVIFFHTDDQVKRLGDAQFAEKCSKAFAEIIRPHDEFSYFRDCPAPVSFDSKETFDTKFHSNWFYYDKR